MWSNFKTSRFSDFSWGLNLRDSEDRIQDTQFRQLINIASEGNKLKVIKWYLLLKSLESGTNRIQGLKLFSNYLIAVSNAKLHIYNLNTWALHTQNSAVTSTTDRFQIVVQKLVDVSIILINSSHSTVEDIKAYEFNITTFVFTSKSFTWLSNLNFKCGWFYEGKLFLGWNPSAPSIVYYSKTFWASSLANIYDFSAYNSGSQPVGDGETIIAFATNNTEFFIVKKNSIFKIIQAVDTWSAYSYQIRQETSTWALNVFDIINVEKDIIYFDWSTIRRLSYEQNIQALSDSAIGKDIESIILSLTQSQESNSFMNYSYPFVKLYLKSNTSSENDFAILYNVVDKWFSIQTWVEANIWTFGSYNSKRVSYVWMRYSSELFQDWQWSTISDSNISFSVVSKKMNMGDTVNFKRFVLEEFAWYISENESVTFNVYVDWKLVWTKTITAETSWTLPATTWSATIGSSPLGALDSETSESLYKFEVKIPFYKVWRDIQYEITWEWAWTFELNYHWVSYKHIKWYEIH